MGVFVEGVLTFVCDATFFQAQSFSINKLECSKLKTIRGTKKENTQPTYTLPRFKHSKLKTIRGTKKEMHGPHMLYLGFS
jgi:hypothetical protein